jgi:limonene-1,2-epoxide hydrolase
MAEDKSDASRRHFLGAGILGALAAGAFSGRAQAAEWTPAEAANVKVVNDFLHALEPRDMSKQAVYMAPDITYRMTETTPQDKGYDAILARLKPYIDGASKIEFEILATYAAGPIVINHRIDRFTSTTRPLTFEGVGVFFLKNGKIQDWTDYTIRVALANQFPGG